MSTAASSSSRCKGVEKAKFLAKEDKPSLNEQLDAVEKEFLADAKVKLYASTDHKQDFLDAIKSRSRPICDVEIGARTVTACHLTNLAYYHGQRLQWDPAKNDFAGGTGDRSGSRASIAASGKWREKLPDDAREIRGWRSRSRRPSASRRHPLDRAAASRDSLPQSSP